MDNYDITFGSFSMSSLNQLIGEKKDIKTKILIERRKLNKEFNESYKGAFKVLDILFIISICFNFGALLITDYMVEKQEWQEAIAKNETITYMEANPAATALHDYQPPETQQQKIRAFSILFVLFKHSLFWSFVIFGYIWLRNHIYSKSNLVYLFFFVCFYFYLLGYDFVRDLALLLAKIYH